ncbi:hypothetical protein K9B33_15580 [Sphingobium sp. 3R8]|uniref:hypothetical protein n=1 Tax=Sphingobium sp. 3R8 TaxID=2874921 RepID=UPI001CCB74E0|nr:hypothetical protein [Sphingobium sp. 3R8]MBZ9648966.1 hypothetical protein [Sphingobium sp. 3R8]
MFAARIVQAGFFFSGLIFLAIVFFGVGGIGGAVLALALTMPFSAIIISGCKCRACGVSYYFSPSEAGWNFTGVNLLKPVESNCRKCGAGR